MSCIPYEEHTASHYEPKKLRNKRNKSQKEKRVTRLVKTCEPTGDWARKLKLKFYFSL